MMIVSGVFGPEEVVECELFLSASLAAEYEAADMPLSALRGEDFGMQRLERHRFRWLVAVLDGKCSLPGALTSVMSSQVPV